MRFSEAAPSSSWQCPPDQTLKFRQEEGRGCKKNGAYPLPAWNSKLLQTPGEDLPPSTPMHPPTPQPGHPHASLLSRDVYDIPAHHSAGPKESRNQERGLKQYSLQMCPECFPRENFGPLLSRWLWGQSLSPWEFQCTLQ